MTKSGEKTYLLSTYTGQSPVLWVWEAGKMPVEYSLEKIPANTSCGEIMADGAFLYVSVLQEKVRQMYSMHRRTIPQTLHSLVRQLQSPHQTVLRNGWEIRSTVPSQQMASWMSSAMRCRHSRCSK